METIEIESFHVEFDGEGFFESGGSSGDIGSL
jgi:hypothetical protein